MARASRSRRLTSIGDFGRLELEAAFERADQISSDAWPDQSEALQGHTLLTLFAEPAGPSQTAYALAGRRLGADVADFPAGESGGFADALVAAEAMGPDILVVRHSAPGAADFAAERSGALVIGAGDGAREDPVQALTDAFVLRRRFGALDGLRVAICGDVLHSRAARSAVGLLNVLNVEVRLAGPPTLLPADADRWGVDVFHDLDEALEACDAVIVLPAPRERISGAFVPSPREYAALYGLTAERLSRANPGAVVLHAGPVGRGVEIAADVADMAEASLIGDQAAAGVAMRMAVLSLMTEWGGNRMGAA